jgi:NodT family efflux transporter outer membrane factor (OMF) lipoprotein
MTVRRRRSRLAARVAAVAAGWAAAACAASGCAAGPKYVPPDPSPPPAFKELGPWKAAEPADDRARGPWWTVFRDDQLNALEEQLTVSNQTLKAVAAQFQQARALVRSAESGRMPQVGAGASIGAVDPSDNKPAASKASTLRYTDYTVRADVAYEADVWGRVSRTIEASRAAAQASAADLESVSLSLHSELAQNYFEVRALDAERQLIDTSVTAFERALELTRNRYKGGVASGVDVAQAETQLHSARAQAIDLGVRRAQLEHAIAVLVGQPASGFGIPAAPLSVTPPSIPVGLPSAVLEQRPDIAGAERRLMAANAQIGVAEAARFPLVALTGSAGFESADLGNWLKLASNFWSVVPAVAVSVFDGGKRRAGVDQAIAAYQRADAQYRDAVLVAFREVEDNLAALRILAEEAAAQTLAVEAAQRSLTLSTNRYRGGVATYLEVVITQAAALQAQRNALGILRRQMAASVLLVKALGGGWDRSSLPAF